MEDSYAELVRKSEKYKSSESMYKSQEGRPPEY